MTNTGDTGLFANIYNPDVLTCLANLSNDEVFTPPELVNVILDSLPQDIFKNPDTKFLDPFTKSGVFLREIAKRLISGLEKQIPDLQERLDHIFHEQLYGIAITELTSLLSRRSVYCSKYPNSDYSVSRFNNAQGNIRFKKVKHTWVDGKCALCGANAKEYNRADDNEAYAYEFIHTLTPEKIFNMKFDVIIGNPPYQLSSGGGGKGSGTAIPIYDKFVEQAKKLNPRFLSMIIPARWYSGGRGLDCFRQSMLKDKRIVKLVDFFDSKECFPGVDVAGGICYFLWSRDNPTEECVVVNHFNQKVTTESRPLDEYDIFIRNNLAVDIVKKVMAKKEPTMDSVVCPVSLFGFNTNAVLPEKGDLKIRHSGGIGYCDKSSVKDGKDIINKYKVIISAASYDHGGQPDKDGKRRILSRVEILDPNVICTSTYIVVNSFDSKEEAENLVKLLKTQFVRFLLSMVCISQHISRDTFKFVPQLDYKRLWTDKDLYQKYNLTSDEIEFIEAMMKPMEGERK